MKREIKFRGFNEVRNQWMFGYLFKYPNGRTIIYESDSSCCGVLPSTVGQFTGLKDGTGKEIYEGDILRLTIPDGTIRHFVVEWASEDRILRPLYDFVPDGNPIRISGWCFNWNGYRLYPTVIDGVPDNEVMEVVGNIHDNPELLKGGE